MSIEFHVKCRDAFQMLADAHNDELEKKNQKGQRFLVKLDGKGRLIYEPLMEKNKEASP